MNFRLCRILAAGLLMLAAAGTVSRVQAQGLTGQISGTVTDSGGGVMPGATVVVKNTGTNLTRDAVTGATPSPAADAQSTRRMVPSSSS